MGMAATHPCVHIQKPSKVPSANVLAVVGTYKLIVFFNVSLPNNTSQVAKV